MVLEPKNIKIKNFTERSKISRNLDHFLITHAHSDSMTRISRSMKTGGNSEYKNIFSMTLTKNIGR